MQYIGKIDKSLFEQEFGKLQTDEVVLTDECDIHIKTQHSQDYSFFVDYRADIISQPDYIIVDRKHISTVLLIKRLPETNLNIVLRLAVETDDEGLKNSIITFFRLRDTNLTKMLKHNKTLYKRI